MSDNQLTTEQVEQVVKKKNRGSDWMKELTAEGGADTKPGDNSRFIRHAMASWGLPKIDISDAKQVEDRIGMYFQYCADNDRKPQIVGMCNWLGITRETLSTWRNGEYRSGAHSDIVKKACAIIEEMWADFMQAGKINPATGIFLAKNWYGYKDVADVVVTPNNPLHDMDAEQARKRIADAIPVDDED